MRRFLTEFLLPSLLFGAVYIGSLLLIAGILFIAHQESMAANHAAGLGAAIIATMVARRRVDQNHWDVGFGGGVGKAFRETVAGVAFAFVLIGGIDLLIILTTGFHHELGRGTDFTELFVLFVPAATHEEILCRGYPFQKLVRINAAGAVISFSVLFALLHLGNDAMSALALGNLVLAGVILSLAYLLFRRLWFPIGLHIAWNVLSGPVLGHEVSGLVLPRTALLAIDPGPSVLTGGRFGIEASAITTLGEVLAIVVLLVLIRWRNRIVPDTVVSVDQSPVPRAGEGQTIEVITES